MATGGRYAPPVFLSRVQDRHGEKLFEELLINAEAIGTDHPLIFRAKENYIEYNELLIKLKLLKKATKQNNLREVLKNLSILVPEWKAKL